MDEEEATWVAATSLLPGNQNVLGSWVQSVKKAGSIPQPGGKHAEEQCAFVEASDAQSHHMHSCCSRHQFAQLYVAVCFSFLIAPHSQSLLPCWHPSVLKVDSCSSQLLKAMRTHGVRQAADSCLYCALKHSSSAGDVDVVMGGPPCQSVSGLNRHGKVKDIMKDPR